MLGCFSLRCPGHRACAAPLARAILLLVALLVAPASLRAEERSVLNGVNAVRSQHGLHPVQASAALVRSARFHSQDMVAHGYFRHGPFWQRMLRFGARGPPEFGRAP